MVDKFKAASVMDVSYMFLGKGLTQDENGESIIPSLRGEDLLTSESDSNSIGSGIFLAVLGRVRRSVTMMLRLGLVAALSFLGWSCSGDDEKTAEPVASEEGKLPETPGADAGTPGALPGAEDPAAAGALGSVNPGQEPAAAPQAGGADYNNSGAPAQAAAPAGATDHVVKVGALNVRKGPGTKHAVVRTLKKGEKVQSWGCQKNWCKIGEGEYVSKKYLK